jgi:hypothetical protein
MEDLQLALARIHDRRGERILDSPIRSVLLDLTSLARFFYQRCTISGILVSHLSV